MWSLLWFFFSMGVFVLVALRLFPPYYNNFKIAEGLSTLMEDPQIKQLNKREMAKRLDNILYIDQVDEVVNLANDLKVEKRRGAMDVKLDYEVVVPLVGNLSGLVSFENIETVEIEAQ